MSSATLRRICTIFLSLLQLAWFVSLFAPSSGPRSESTWQMLFPNGHSLHHAPVVIAGLFFLPARSVSGSLLHWGSGLSFLLILVEAISLARALGVQQTRASGQPEHWPGTRDAAVWQEERSSVNWRLCVSLILLCLLCYLLVSLSLFFPYTDTEGGLEPVSFQTSGWAVFAHWLTTMLPAGLFLTFVLAALLALLLVLTRTRQLFRFLRERPVLLGTVICCHLFNLLGLVLCVGVLLIAILNTGDLHGPFQIIEATFGTAPGAFLLALLGSGLLLAHFLEPRREATAFPAPTRMLPL
ncbi:MAG TPA: hypothetical protein VGF67_25630 [Ktedonobacteraceae bacterium]